MLGVGGYVAPRHLRAIASLGHKLALACDPSDSVGVLDSYFPEVQFTSSAQQFFEQLQSWRGTARAVDIVSIATPNHLHVQQSCAAMAAGADVLCEKPLVLTISELQQLRAEQGRTGRKVYTVLQLRLHPALVALRNKVRATSCLGSQPMSGHLQYVTSRGPWYLQSWKGDEERSGGIVANIGVHLFDALIWVFGPVQSHRVLELTAARARGEVQFARAKFSWLLSVRSEDLPAVAQEQGCRTHRELVLDGCAVEFSDGFSELHTESYARMLEGNGFGIEEACAAVQWVESIRSLKPVVALEL